MRYRLKKHLLYLAFGELGAALVFAYLLKHPLLGSAGMTALTFCIFILIQGSAFWMFKYITLLKKHKNHSVKFILIAFNYLNAVSAVGVFVSIIVVSSSQSEFLIALCIYLFALIEYINYYWYRLSYGTSGFNLWLLFNTPLQKSSIRKEIERVVVMHY